jgi:hypothetical protein
MGAERIAWHPAFRQALALDLEDYLDILHFEAEYQLTAEPMIIDLLVTKKDAKAVIANPIALNFRGFNAFEFKSPTDYLSMEDFYKGLAYSFSYKSQSKVDILDITFSFVVSHYPREVIKELHRIPGYRISETSPGIHSISALGLVVQIIESKKLLDGANLFLSHLRNDLDAGRFQNVLIEAKKRHKVGIDAYIDVLSRANAEVLREVLMHNPSFEQVIEDIGLSAKWEVRGEARGRREEKRQNAQSLKRIGVPLNQIAEALGLSMEEVIQV